MYSRIVDELIVTRSVKTELVSYLRDAHHMYVVAFGDKCGAHETIVVVGEHTRSKTMEKDLQDAMDMVDSVIDSGKSVIEFLWYIRSLDATVCIVVVGVLSEAFERDMNLHLVALRVSNNQFTQRIRIDFIIMIISKKDSIS